MDTIGRCWTWSVTSRLFTLSLATACIVSSPALGADEPVSDDAISDAIDRGIEYLLGQVDAQQLGQHKVGQLALETYALVVAGVSVQHPLIQQCFKTLHSEARRTQHTYTISCYIFALDAAISQIENDLLILSPKKLQVKFRDDPRIGSVYRPYLESAVGALVGMQNQLGAWRYKAGAKDFDNSNVQFAVLALGVGAKRRVRMDPSVWQKVMDHFVEGQQANGPEIQDRITLRKEGGERRDVVKLIPKDGKKPKKRGDDKDKEKSGGGRTVVKPENPEIGTEKIQVFQRGWDYQNKGGATWNMTCAGLSSLVLARDNLRGKLDRDAREALNAAVRDGYGWVMGHWSPTASYYGMYSLEKVADLGGVELFGSHDWFEELSRFLVSQQGGDGSWPGGGAHGEKGNPRVATSFALLILNRATSLLTMNPAARIMISGRGGANDPNDRSWVYIEELDTSIHYPTLLRQIRLRPSPRLVRFLRNIVRNYPEEWKGELIPPMAKFRDSIRSKSVRRVIEGYLEEITGYRYKDWHDYLKWHRRWERVILIGMKKKKERTSDLLSYYKSTTKSIPLKQSVAWALVQCGAKQAIPLFLEDLGHTDADMRLTAYNSFRAFFLDFPPPFNASGSRSTREAQVEKIKEWYGQQMARSGGG